MTAPSRGRPKPRRYKRYPAAVPLWESPAPADPRWGYTLGDDFIEWTEANLVVPRAQLRGQPLRWSEWQKRFFRRLYTCDEEGSLLYRTVILAVPKKNTKSTMAATIALYDLFGDPYEEDPWVVIGSNSDSQADIVFGDCKTICEIAPSLTDVSIRWRREIRSKAGPGYIERVAAGKGKLDGKDCSKLCLDELHEMDRENWKILTNAMTGRQRAQAIGITTAGDAYESELLLDLVEKGRRVAEGEDDDERFLFVYYGAPDGAKAHDSRVWAAAHPNWGVTVDFDRLLDRYKNNTESDWRRYYMNQFVDYADAPWVPPEDIQACRLPPFELRPDYRSFVGVDLSETRDATGVVTGQMWSDDDRPCGHQGDYCLYIRARAWAPPVDGAGKRLPGYQIPQAEVKQHIRDQASAYEVENTVWDPWHSKLMRQDLEAEGLPCEEIYQTGARRTGASAQLRDLVVNKRLHYCDDVVERHMLAAGIRPSGKDGGFFLAKRMNGRPMDVAMAAVNVVYGTMFAEPEEPSVYENRGLRTVG